MTIRNQQKSLTEVYLQPGDIFFTQSGTVLGRLIRRFTQQRGEPRTLAQHCGLVVNGGYITRGMFPQAWIVEAVSEVKWRAIRTGYGDTGIKLTVYRPLNLSYDARSLIRERARQYIGKKYGHVKIIAHFLDWCLGGEVVFRTLCKMDNYPICSYLVAKCFQAVGADFGIRARAASPDDILDFCQVNTDKYRLILPWVEI